MSEIPADIMREARRIYDLPIYEDASLNSLVSNRSQDYVLVAISRAILAENQRCAKIANEWSEGEPKDEFDDGICTAARGIANQIRRR